MVNDIYMFIYLCHQVPPSDFFLYPPPSVSTINDCRQTFAYSKTLHSRIAHSIPHITTQALCTHTVHAHSTRIHRHHTLRTQGKTVSFSATTTFYLNHNFLCKMNTLVFKTLKALTKHNLWSVCAFLQRVAKE